MQTAKQIEEQPSHLFQRGRSGNPLGRRLQKNRVAEDEAERAAEVQAILADFGSVPSHLEKRLIGELASELIRARRLRAAGKDAQAAECVRLVSRLASQLGLRRDKRPGKPQVPTIHEYIASLAPQPAVAPTVAAATEEPAAKETHGRPAIDDGEGSGELPA
jgi:hypothetical protein